MLKRRWFLIQNVGETQIRTVQEVKSTIQERFSRTNSDICTIKFDLQLTVIYFL